MKRRTFTFLLTSLVTLACFPAASRSEDLPPPVVDLCDWQTPIRNQGGRGSCTYHPPIAALEAAYRRRGQAVELSVEHLIWLRNVTAQSTAVKDPDINENNLAFLTGGGLSVNFDLLARYGVCRAEHMPYLNDHEDYNQTKHYGGFDVTDYRWWEPFRQVSLNRFNLDPKHLPLAARHDARYGIKDYVFFGGPDCQNPRKIEALIASGHEVAINVFIAYKPKPGDPERAKVPPIIWYRAKDAEWVPGDSHAMLLVGYDRPRQFFVVKNSWGPAGGDAYNVDKLPDGWKDLTRFRGYTLMHYNFLAGNREAAYIKEVVDPAGNQLLAQRALGLWEVVFRQKSTEKEVGKAVLAWRRLPNPTAKDRDHRIGDWYGAGCKECRVNADLAADRSSVTLYLDFDRPQQAITDTRGTRLAGKLTLPADAPAAITDGAVTAADGATELFGVPVADLTFTAAQSPKDNPLMGVDPNPNLLTNGSFEEGPDVSAYTTLKTGATAIKGWAVIGEQIDYIGTHWNAADGKRSLDLHGSPGFGGIQQTIKTEPGHCYRVTFKMAGTPRAFGSAGGLKRLTVSAAGATQEFTFDTTGKTAAAMGWEPKTWEFTATTAETTLAFHTADKHDPNCGPALDQVCVVAVAARK